MHALGTKLKQISREGPKDSPIETSPADTVKESSFLATEEFFYLRKGRALAWRRAEKADDKRSPA